MKLTAQNLKNELWATLQGLSTGAIQPGQGDAIASQAREILRTTNLQLRVAQQAKRNITTAVIDFAEEAE